MENSHDQHYYYTYSIRTWAFQQCKQIVKHFQKFNALRLHSTWSSSSCHIHEKHFSAQKKLKSSSSIQTFKLFFQLCNARANSQFDWERLLFELFEKWKCTWITKKFKSFIYFYSRCILSLIGIRLPNFQILRKCFVCFSYKLVYMI